MQFYRIFPIVFFKIIIRLLDLKWITDVCTLITVDLTMCRSKPCCKSSTLTSSYWRRTNKTDSVIDASIDSWESCLSAIHVDRLGRARIRLPICFNFHGSRVESYRCRYILNTWGYKNTFWFKCPMTWLVCSIPRRNNSNEKKWQSSNKRAIK